MGKVLGISREDEEKQLKKVIDIADMKLNRTRGNIKALTEELRLMQTDFDESDKEMQSLWHNTDDRLKEIKQELGRAEQARRKPYFGRIDFADTNIGKNECCYIGRSVIARDPANPEVIDWRAPLAGIYYDNSLGKVSYLVRGEGRYTVDLTRKRTYEIEGDELIDFYDSDVIANDELLTKYLAKNKKSVLSEIIATIQAEQNSAIRKSPLHNMIVQGAAGSGKTTVAMHRISYILYNYEQEFAPRDFYIIGSNQVLLNYITGVLPDLNVYGVEQMTMEQLFVRLLYNDWTKDFKIKPLKAGETPAFKGQMQWFKELEDFCREYEWNYFKRCDVVIEKTGAILLTKERIEELLTKFDYLSRADKIERLTDHLMSAYETEVAGRYYSYNFEERKRMKRTYENYFGKREWKGSVFDLYDDFLRRQKAHGYDVSLPEGSYDLYDLAALAYIYKRIREENIVREASHVVIDEAQDFGMMAYACLKYCLSKCTYTIMGDVSQNITLDYGLNDWQELRALMLPNEYDWFGLLKKSYRNTVEISDFATEILYHGSFQIYPVQPIIRHGNAVSVTGKTSFEELVDETAKTINEWMAKGLETIAVICSDEKEAALVTNALGTKIELLPNDTDSMEFSKGVLVLPLKYTKGLEFDAVVIFDASKENYPYDDGHVKQLYVAATRALHELAVLYKGEVTPLIGEPAPAENRKMAVVESDKFKPTLIPEEEEITTAELHRRRAAEGDKDMAEREKYGPARIIIKPKAKEEPKGTDVSGNGNGANGEKKYAGGNGANGEKKYAGGNGSDDEKKYTNVRIKLDGNQATVPSYLETVKKECELKEGPKKTYGEFFEMPDNAALQPPGHGRIDCSIKMCMKGTGYFDLMSNYGTLRIMPVGNDTIRVSFGKPGTSFTKPEKELIKSGCKFKSKDSKECLEILTEKLGVKVDKKTGVVSFLNSAGNVILTEDTKLPVLLSNVGSYVFFAFGKKERINVRRPEGGAAFLGNTAKYISFGPECDILPALSSDKGYEIYAPAKKKVLACNIAMYGTYLKIEDSDVVDYYVKGV